MRIKNTRVNNKIMDGFVNFLHLKVNLKPVFNH